MHMMIRPLAVFSVVSGLSLLAFQVSTTGAQGADGPQTSVSRQHYSLGPSKGVYDLAQLEILETALYHVEESYVEPARIDWERMYVEALEGVEDRVPVTMFRREPGGKLLHLEVGSTRTVLEVPAIGNRKQLHEELVRVAAILRPNLRPTDIPMDDSVDAGDPYAHVEYAMINGILGTLDPHSRLLPPEASKQMDVENQGEFGGLGITIIERDGRLTVEYPLPDTPAEHAGLVADDQIVRIDGVSTINMQLDEAVTMLRGPVGAPVSIEVMREGLTEPMPVTIVRDRISINPVEAKLLDESGVGYVVIKGFHAKVNDSLRAKLAELQRQNGNAPLRGLILDLRDNPGGFLNQAEAVADTFLERGTIVSQVDGLGRKLEEYSAKASGSEPQYPIVVLVNASSASASEIVAGALRNNERAVIVGERTYGKGSVQNLHPFHDESKLKLTISKYLTPGDKSIQAVGVPADIELVPAVVERKTDEETAKETDITLLYFRERVRREADADKHLEQLSMRIEDPSYSVRYLRPSERKRRTSADLDLSGDLEVQFARELLLAPGAAPRRADFLMAAAPVVAKYQRKGDKDIAAALQIFSIDWKDGPSVPAADLSVKFDLGEDGVLVAGQEERVALEVTNNGDTPIYRAAAVATFEGDYTPREFVFGYLAPGATRRYEQPVQLVAGHPTELTPVTFTFRDAGGKEIAVQRARLPVQGQALPKLTWDLDVRGNGAGGVAVGEKVVVDLTVTNVGEGQTSADTFARIRNKSGRALDITRGTIEPGHMRAADGSACQVLEAGLDGGVPMGDAATGAARIERGDAPKWAEGCKRTLKSGETWKGSFEVLVKEAAPNGLELELSLGDAASYDHASIVRAGFYSYFVQQQELTFALGKPLVDPRPSVPPDIQVTRTPDVVVDSNRVSVSGLVTDDHGIAHVEVYHAGDKVFFQGSVADAHVRSVPYTADIRLEPGLNTITVLATDEDGFTDTASIVTFYLAPELAEVSDVMPKGDIPELERRLR